jgi:hypothetical protein
MKLLNTLTFPDSTVQTTAAVLESNSSDTSAAHVVTANDTRLSDTRTPASASITTKAQFSSAMAATQKGSSNPGSPTTDDTNLRTDLRRIGDYDGTRWLSTAPVPIPWMPNSTLNPFSVSGADTWYAILPTDLALYLERWTSLVKVNTTNSIANYWTVELKGFVVAGTSTTLDSFSTAGLTVNTNVMANRALTTALTAGQYDFLAIIATKTGSPGTLFLMPHLRAREILT